MSESCKGAIGIAPVINAHKCEGKADCVRVCPYGVFEVRRVTDGEWAALPVLSKLKVFFHGGKQGFVLHPEACMACGLCVTACPEKAIKLQRL